MPPARSLESSRQCLRIRARFSQYPRQSGWRRPGPQRDYCRACCEYTPHLRGFASLQRRGAISQNNGDSGYNPPTGTRAMTATYNPGVHRFAIFVVCWTVLLFVAGALVTSKDAALSVTDWPTSHGALVPPLSSLQGGDLFEFSHRVFAGCLVILTV